MLLVNLSYERKDLLDFVQKNPKWENQTLLDFSATIEIDQSKKVYYPSYFDEGNKLHEKALSNYIEASGRLSRLTVGNGDIRSFTYLNLPLFWITSIAEKHPQGCIMKNLYYFELIWEKIRMNYSQVAFVLPINGLHHQSAIRNFILKRNKIKVVFNLPRKNFESFRYYIGYLKGYEQNIQRLKSTIRKLRKGRAEVGGELIFTYYPGTWNSNSGEDVILGDVEKLIASEGKRPKYLPYFLETKTIGEFEDHPKFPSPSLFASFPTFWQRSRMYISLLNLYKKIDKTSFEVKDIEFVDDEVLKHEFNQLLFYRINHILNYVWLINFFKKSKNSLKLYYQDEFYVSGRVISAAARSVKGDIKSIGVQHGIFYEAHTVYSLTDDELRPTKNDNGLPIPYKFIVWGSFFKKHFLKFNTLPQSYVIEAGYLKYIQRSKQSKSIIEAGQMKSNKIRVLWCTTLKSDTIKQYKLIHDAVLGSSNIELIVRCHPYVPLREFVQNELNFDYAIKNMEFSNEESVFMAMEKCDVVLCGSGSSVFLDAMVVGKPICHIVNDDYYMGTLGVKEMTEIRSAKDLKFQFGLLVDTIKAQRDYSTILNTDVSLWEEVVRERELIK